MKKEEIKMEAVVFAQTMRSIAKRINFDADDYDTKWPKTYVKEIESEVKEFLKKVK